MTDKWSDCVRSSSSAPALAASPQRLGSRAKASAPSCSSARDHRRNRRRHPAWTERVSRLRLSRRRRRGARHGGLCRPTPPDGRADGRRNHQYSGQGALSRTLRQSLRGCPSRRPARRAAARVPAIGQDRAATRATKSRPTRRTARSVTAVTKSGERIAGVALIGADGLWSAIRASVVGDGAPRVSGHTTYRSVIPTEQMPDDLRWNAATLVGRAEMPPGALSAVRLESVQPRRHLSQQRAGTGCRQAGVARGSARRFPAYSSARAEHHQAWFQLAAVGAVRPRTGRELGRRPRRAARRCRASDDAIHGARRLHGAGRRRVSFAHGRTASR